MDDGAPYMIMEHLEGHDLAKHLELHGPLPIEDAIRIARVLTGRNTIMKISGSPICAYGHDFNPSILDENGDFVFFGPFLVRALVFVRWPLTGSPRR